MSRLLWVGVTSLLVLFLALITGFQPLFWLLYVLVAGSAIGYFWAWLQSLGLNVRIQEISLHPQVGRPVDLQVAVEEQGGLPRLGLRARLISDFADNDEVEFNLSPHSSTSWTTSGICRHRGWNDVGTLAIVSSDMTGILKMQWRRGLLQQILVYPNPLDLPRGVVAGGTSTGEIGETGSLPGPSQTVFMVREYVPGDARSHIHWPSTARKDQLMTKEFEGAGINEMWLIVDMERDVHAGEGNDSTEEYCVTIASSMAKALIEEGHVVGFVSHGNGYHKLEPRKGPEQLWGILKALALVKAEGRLSLPYLMEKETADMAAGTVVMVVSTWPGRNISSVAGFLSRRGIVVVSILVDSPSFGAKIDSRRQGVLGGENRQWTFLVQKDDDLPTALRSVLDRLASY